MRIIPRVVLFVLALAVIPPHTFVFASLETPIPTPLSLAYQIVEGHVIAKGVLLWEERVSPMNDIQLKREYLVLENTQSMDERIVLEFEPILISIDQFHLGEKIQAQLAADGSIVSAKHIK